MLAATKFHCMKTASLIYPVAAVAGYPADSTFVLSQPKQVATLTQSVKRFASLVVLVTPL